MDALGRSHRSRADHTIYPRVRMGVRLVGVSVNVRDTRPKHVQ